MAVMWVLLITAAMLHVSHSIPIIPKAQAVENEQPTNQNHEVDNVEVHHDVKAGQGQDLIDDALPEKDDIKYANAVEAGEGKQSLVENNVDKVLETKLHIKVKPPKPKDQAEPAVAESQVLRVKPEERDENVVLSEETVKKLKKLSIDKLIPADHLDIVKMERDGHVNRDYHKEMFLGGLHDEFKAEAVDQATVRLQEIVARADLDGDGFLSSSEMEKWILAKMNEHFEAAKKENDMIFDHLDPDGDGFIKWKEYYVHFLLSRGFDAESAVKHVADYDDVVKLEQEDKNALISYKFKWTDADTNITDNRLSKEEFMVFRHPEHSQKSLETVVSNVMRGVDANDDKVITEEEFAALPPGEVESKEFEEMDRKWQEERRKEFREIMDTDGDGKVGLTELKNYLDPTNPVQAKVEADSLISLMDDNKDSLLSMEEILKHSDIFISSKLVNFAANMHDEF